MPHQPPVSLDVVLNEQGHINRRIEQHKSEHERAHAKLEGVVEAQGEEIDKLKHWQSRLSGVYLLGIPVVAILTSLLQHWVEKHL